MVGWEGEWKMHVMRRRGRGSGRDRGGTGTSGAPRGAAAGRLWMEGGGVGARTPTGAQSGRNCTNNNGTFQQSLRDERGASD